MTLLFHDQPDQVTRLAARFAEVGFHASGVEAVLGPGGASFLAREELGPVLRRTRGGSPIETLVRLFLCATPVERAAAERALGDVRLADCVGAELLSTDGDEIAALVRLRPVDLNGDDWIVASDLMRRGDHVVGVGPASLTLAGVTIRHHVARCLDLGAGSGIQALAASRHADSVVATDRNPRAVAFTEFTARLNGVDSIVGRAGDRFEPVVGDVFGLIVSNPPFVISPESRFIYRDSGMTGDEICRTIVREAPRHLEDDGYCQILANWAHVGGAPWQDRLAEWVDGLGCDAWIVQSKSQDAETYATGWITQEEPDRRRAAEVFEEWMDYYERIGLTGVGFGVITLRRTDRANPWICLEELAQEFVLPCGDHIAGAFDRARWLSDHGGDDRALLDTRLVVNHDMVLRQSSFAADGDWFHESRVVELQHGLHYAVTVDEYSAAFLAGCDGATPVGALVQRIADSIGADPADITVATLAMARRLIQQGFVGP